MTRIAAAAVVMGLLLPVAAMADPPSRVTIVAVFEPITYGETGYVNGQLLGDAQAGQVVSLEQSAPPFTDWTPVAQVTSDAQSYYSFKLRNPSQTLQYRTNSQGTPSDRTVQISVAPRITLKASAAGKSSIRFSGTFGPALNGQSVAIQRRDSSGSWTTVANARLHGGRTFQGRLRAHSTATLRAFFATDGAHLDGFSNAVTVKLGKNAHTARAAATCAAPRITQISTKPDPPVSGSPFSLRVRSRMTGGKIYAIDVLWGEGDKRDHFTLAPTYRHGVVTFTLRHRYTTPGTYRLTIRTFGRAGACKRASARAHPRLTVG